MSIVQSEIQVQQRNNQVKNMLIRYAGNKNIRDDCIADEDYQHPENSYLVKYFPKYYKNLTLMTKPQHSLLSKIKKIKRLKKFSGDYNDKIPQVDWFKVLANNRKEMEELPQIHLWQYERSPWAKTSLHAVKFFFQITSLHVPIFHCYAFYHERLPFLWEFCSKYIRNMRKLKILKIDVYKPEIGMLLLNKLNRMPMLLGKLDVLKLQLSSNVPKELLQNQKIFSHLTHIKLSLVPLAISPIPKTIPQICSSLKSFSLSFDVPKTLEPYVRPLVYSKFVDFIIPTRKIPQLQRISIIWPRGLTQDFLSFFIPPASLRKLKLDFTHVNWTVFGSLLNSESYFDHWEEIEMLDVLDVHFTCHSNLDILFTKNLMTAMLKKVVKLASFRCAINTDSVVNFRYKPFRIEEVAHLYEHLKKFKADFSLYERLGCVGFDFSFLGPFKNLNEIEFTGFPCSWGNIGDAIRLLESNNKEYSRLELAGARFSYAEELKDLLTKISKAKKGATNLKVDLYLQFLFEPDNEANDDMEFLDQFCQILEWRAVRGLEVFLHIGNHECSRDTFDKVKSILALYPKIRNFILEIFDGENTLKYIKRDGEKEQLLLCEIEDEEED